MRQKEQEDAIKAEKERELNRRKDAKLMEESKRKVRTALLAYEFE